MMTSVKVQASVGIDEVLFSVAFNMGPVILHMVKNSEDLQKKVKEGWFARTVVMCMKDITAGSEDGNVVFPVVQWLPGAKLRRKSCRDILCKDFWRTSVLYLLIATGDTRPYIATHKTVSVPLNEEEMYGDVPYKVVDDYKDPPSVKADCGHCGKIVSFDDYLCDVCSLVRFCSAKCKRRGKEEHTIKCMQIINVMDGNQSSTVQTLDAQRPYTSLVENMTGPINLKDVMNRQRRVFNGTTTRR